MLSLVLALALLQPLLHARLLPPLVVVWFGLDGRALLWVTRGWLLAATALPALLMGALAIGVLRPLGARPGGAVLERLGLWLGIITAASLAALAQLVFNANALPVPELAMGDVAWLGASYALFLVAWLGVLRYARR